MSPTYLCTLPTSIHHLPTYITYLHTSPTYVHHLPTYVYYLPLYVHYLPMYITCLRTSPTYVHHLPTYITYLRTSPTYVHHLHMYITYLCTLPTFDTYFKLLTYLLFKCLFFVFGSFHSTMMSFLQQIATSEKSIEARKKQCKDSNSRALNPQLLCRPELTLLCEIGKNIWTFYAHYYVIGKLLLWHVLVEQKIYLSFADNRLFVIFVIWPMAVTDLRAFMQKARKIRPN